MALLTGKEIQANTLKYLRRERDQHKRDIATNEGKVQEIEELIRVMERMCLYCGKEIYTGWNEDQEAKMSEHIIEAHPEEQQVLT